MPSRQLGERWYLVEIEPRRDLRAIMFLSMAGFAVRMPKYIDAERQVPAPMFPGYLFVKFDAADDTWRAIAPDTMPGVLRLFLANEHTPLPLPVGVVETWLEESGESGVIDAREPAPEFPPGSHVLIADGPFTSFAAIVKWSEGDRLRVLASIFGRDTPVDLRRNQVERA